MAIVYKYIFTDEMGFQTQLLPDTGPTYQALFLGVLIPTISAILPVRSALALSLNESLNVQRSKVSGTVIDFFDSTKTNPIPYICFGALGLAFGVSIYYFMPMSML